MRKLVVYLLVCYCFLAESYAQTITQTIRGIVKDGQSHIPLPGATVILLNSEPLVGTTTDADGKFRMEKVPVGRQGIQVSYIGYNTIMLTNISLTSGKEVVLTIELEEKVVTGKEIVVVAETEKDKPLNEMATVSARTFSVEETQRYAGGRNDIARMASNFAGVRGGNDSRNDIIIRGNSPLGLLYRLEGVDIPNPNHFAVFGTTGGPVSMLNNNLLTNSDFMTGAFPAEYGNAISGVFDLKMRNGNNEKREFVGQMGFNGAELLAEGPFSKKKKASYLISYRYSTLEFFKLMGIDFGTSSVPEYQDLSFKFNFTHKKGNTSLFGIGGISSISMLDSERDTTSSSNIYGDAGEDLVFGAKQGVVGLSHTYLINNTTYLKFIMAASASTNTTADDSLSTIDRSPVPLYRNNFLQSKLSGTLLMNKKISARHNIRLGMISERMGFDMTDSVLNNQTKFITLTDYNGYTYLMQIYAQWQYKITDRIVLNSGIHYQRFTYNNIQALEPRLGLSWSYTPTQRLSLGYGIHSQLAPIQIYFSQVELPNGEYKKMNKHTNFIKSEHYILAYDWRMTEHTRLKIETYYQHITQTPVDSKPNTYSMLNQGANFFVPFPDTVISKGTGCNYGAEITLERFLKRGLYFLFTSSLYKSKYKGSDGIERNTAFNGNYVFNLLAGKEIALGKKKKEPEEGKKQAKYVLSFDGKIAWYGGQRYTPIDKSLSLLTGYAVYDYTKAYSVKYKDYFRVDARAGLKKYGKKVTQEWVVDIQNVLNTKNISSEKYNSITGVTEYVYQLGFIPVMQYRIEF